MFLIEELQTIAINILVVSFGEHLLTLIQFLSPVGTSKSRRPPPVIKANCRRLKFLKKIGNFIATSFPKNPVEPIDKFFGFIVS